MIRWQDLREGDFRDSTIQLRNNQIIRMHNYILENHHIDINEASIYSKPTFKDIALDFLHNGSQTETKEYGIASQISMLDIFLALIVHFNGKTMIYKDLYELQKELKHKYVSSVKPADLTVDFLEEINKKALCAPSRALKVLGGLTIRSDVGGIRVSDIVKTKMHSNDDYNYIDFTEKKWIIRGDKTKNHQDRSFDLSDETLFFITETSRGDWVVANKNLQPYKDARFLGRKFKAYYGVEYGCIRKGYVQKVNLHANIAETIKHSNKLGHKFETDIEKYTTSVDNKIKISVRLRE